MFAMGVSRIGLVFLVSSVLVACSGGGGSGTPDNSTYTKNLPYLHEPLTVTDTPYGFYSLNKHSYVSDKLVGKGVFDSSGTHRHFTYDHSNNTLKYLTQMVIKESRTLTFRILVYTLKMVRCFASKTKKLLSFQVMKE